MAAASLLLLSLLPLAPAAAPGPKQSDLKPMVHIDWARLPDIPKQGSTKSGFQDSDGGWLDDTTVLTAFGYSSGGIPGFLNTAWILNTSVHCVTGSGTGDSGGGGGSSSRLSASTSAPATDVTAADPNTTCSYEVPGGRCGRGGYEPLMCYTAKRIFPNAKNGGCGALTCHGVASYCDSATGFCVTNSTPKAQPCIALPPPGPSPPPTPGPPPPASGGVWEQLPSAPVCGRQEVSAAIVNGEAYYVGGFSYIPGPSKTHPYCFNDTLKLSRSSTTGKWQWTKLPDFPYVISSFGLASVGTDLYLIGGADYDSKGFYVLHDRHGGIPNQGARMYKLDTLKPFEKGWQRLADLPGVPRWVHAVSSVVGELYVIGGALTDDQGTTHTVVDNWKYSPQTSNWSRLADLPISSGNFQTNGEGAFLDRYILLVGGYQYSDIAQPHGGNTTRLVPSYGTPTKMCHTKPSITKPNGDCLPHCPPTASDVPATVSHLLSVSSVDIVDST